jgi:hypothetical protein
VAKTPAVTLTAGVFRFFGLPSSEPDPLPGTVLALRSGRPEKEEKRARF